MAVLSDVWCGKEPAKTCFLGDISMLLGDTATYLGGESIIRDVGSESTQVGGAVIYLGG